MLVHHLVLDFGAHEMIVSAADFYIAVRLCAKVLIIYRKPIMAEKS
jgi:hypothetical protein